MAATAKAPAERSNPAGGTDNVTAQVDPAIKEQAEIILARLGLTASQAINLLYRQIVLTRGLPFPVSLPQSPGARREGTGREMSREEFGVMLERELAEARAGRNGPREEPFPPLYSR